MEGNHFYGTFLFCHDEILSGSAFSVKVYVFMEDLPVGPGFSAEGAEAGFGGELEIIIVGVSGQDCVAGLLVWGIRCFKGSRARAGGRVVRDHVPGAFPEIEPVGDVVFHVPLGQGHDTLYQGGGGHHNRGRHHDTGQQISHQPLVGEPFQRRSPG